MIESERSRKRLALVAAAAGCALWLAAETVPAEAQASRTRPGGSSSSGSASRGGGGGGGSSSATRGGSSGGSRSSGPVSVGRTRPPSSSSGSGSPTVVEKRRPRAGGHRDFRHHHHRGFYGGFYGHPYGYWGPFRHSFWGWSWWYPWYPHGYPPGPYGVSVYPSRVRASMGALDTDLWPGKTQIWINGQYVGYADQFDGFPRYLWLEKGTYDVAFYLEGFQTLARQYTVYPGLVIDVEDRLQEGEAIHPTDLAPETTPRRDERLRSERERRRATSEPEWRRRVRSDRAAARPSAPADADGPVDARGEPARVLLDIEPDDAAVYLDGRFVGTAAELEDGDAGLLVDTGPHELEVVRPGMASRTVEFEVEAGEEIDLDVALEER